ncbi:MAG: hypothetical protein PHR14_11590 [Oscillospiraceae bacterium]|nr:hypothetical protein [Oscillospiraceae bacterium]
MFDGNGRVNQAVNAKEVEKANQANALSIGGFDYAFCGGFAIELFLDKTVREHGVIDISAY